MLKGEISNFFIVAYLAHLVESVPADYCLYPLNRSDCGMKPTAVISYYKPGSRCEIEYWRGCPTLNKFDNQYDCNHMCIYRYRVIKEDVVAIDTIREEESEGVEKLKKIENVLKANLSVLPDKELSHIKEAVELLDTKLQELLNENETSSATSEPRTETIAETTGVTITQTTAEVKTTTEFTAKRIETTLIQTTLPETTLPETTPPETTPPQTASPETAPPETTPAETTPAETTPAETTPAETTPAETTPAETTPAETTPAETPRAQTTTETTTELVRSDDAGYASELVLA